MGAPVAAKLIVGLGNPEPRYAQNRHNLGFQVVEALAGKLGARWGAKFDGELAQADVGETKVLLLKPLTFMNRSGDSVGPAQRFFKVEAGEVIVVHDELDLPLGRIQLKVGGGSGGHNGLKSIAQCIGTPDFTRLRLGVGRPPEGWDPADYVLSDFRKDEAEAVEAEVDQAVAALSAVVEKGIKQAMNQYNRRA